MPYKSHIQWCGLALLIAGLLFFSGIWHPADDVPGVLSPVWIPVHVCAFIAGILLLYGLIGLYALHAGELGRLGLIGFLLAFTSGVILPGIAFYEFAVLPILVQDPHARVLADLQSGAIMKGSFGMLLFLSFFAFFIGFVLFGIRCLRVRLVPRLGIWSAIMGYVFLILGIMMVTNVDPAQSAVFSIAMIVKNGGQIMISIGYIWVGYSIWSGDQTSDSSA